MSSRAPFFAALALSLFALSEAHADGMRCGTKLVSTGDSPYEVESRCGTPNDKQRRVEMRTERAWISAPCAAPNQTNCGRVLERTVEVTIDEWIYDFGPERLVQRLTFLQGRLDTVVSGSYGTRRD